MELPPDDQLLASAARFLIDGREEDVANLLLSCSLSVWESGDSWFVGDETHYALHVKLTGLHAAYEVLRNDRYPITQSIPELSMPYTRRYLHQASHCSRRTC